MRNLVALPTVEEGVTRQYFHVYVDPESVIAVEPILKRTTSGNCYEDGAGLHLMSGSTIFTRLQAGQVCALFASKECQ